LQLLVLLRFLVFIALVYLALHVLVSRMISKPEHKVLRFFALLTSPLLYPIRIWLGASASETRLLHTALMFYGLLWVLAVLASKIIADRMS